MGNFGVAFKRFIKNKNTVTIICVILIVAVIWIGYSWRIKSQTNPVRVPYATQDIQPRTRITAEMIGYMDVPASMLQDNTVRSIDQIEGKYANYNTVIPEGSLFYSSTLVNFEDMPDSAFSDIPDGYTVVSLPVNNDSTYGNSIYPGNYIDLELPIYNVYYESTDCKDYPDFKYCREFLSKEITDEEFNTALAEYIVDKEISENSLDNESILEDFLTKENIILLSISFVILIIIIIFVVKTLKLKKL